MLTESKNKAMGTKEVKKKDVLEKFFYSGETKYKPVTIEARNQQEADELYEKQKVEVSNN